MHSSRGNAEAKALFYFASPPLTYDRRDQHAQKRILADSFAGLGWEVPRLLDAMWKADDFYFDSISQINVDRLSKGRIVLLGDAGYCASPLSGMGSGLAIVGAYVLAGELAAAGGDHRVAFSGYEEQMRPFTEACKKQGKGGGAWWIPASRAMIMLRNLNYRLLPFLPWRKLIADLPLKAANAITLKTYETLEVPAR